MKTHPAIAAHAGDRNHRFIAGDIAAIHAWVADLNRSDVRADTEVVALDTASGVEIHQHGDDGLDLSIARFRLENGRWVLQWQRQNERWQNYTDTSYLTAAIPMTQVEQDEDGVFWG